MKTQVEINNRIDPDISSDAISTIVTLPENGLPMAVLVANNEKGKSYLENIKLYDTLTIKMAFEDTGNIDWNNVEPIFKGKVIDISPTMSTRGETVSVTAITGDCLKQMRVAKEYEKILDSVTYNDTLYVDSFTGETNQWSKYGSSPYLTNDTVNYIYTTLAPTNETLWCNGWVYVHNDWTKVNGEGGDCLSGENDDKYISIACINDCLNGYDEYYTFENYNNTWKHINSVTLQVKLKVSGRSTEVSVGVHIYDGDTWHIVGYVIFNTSTFTWNSLNASSYLDTWTKINNARLKIQFVNNYGDESGSIECDAVRLVVSVDDEGATDYAYQTEDLTVKDYMTINNALLQLYTATYDFELDTKAYITVDVYDGVSWVYLPPKQVLNEDWIVWDVTNSLDFNNINNFKFRIKLYYVEGTRVGTVMVLKACLYVYGSGYNIIMNPILREILTNSSYGIVPRFIERILDTEESSNYTLNTDYVYNWSEEYPYLNFPYVDGVYCLNELIKIGTSMAYIKNGSQYRGLHWILLPNTTNDTPYLLIAPISDHHVPGIDNSTFVDSKWDSHYSNDIIVKQDMIRKQFKTEVPLANYVLVAGKYVYPINDNWTESLDGWDEEHYNIGLASTDTIFTLNNTLYIKGNTSLEWRFTKGIGGVVDFTGYIKRSLNSDFTKLISRDSGVSIGLQIYGPAKGTILALRLYCGDKEPEWEASMNEDRYELKGSFFEYNLLDHIGDDEEWYKIEATINEDDKNWTPTSDNEVSPSGLWKARAYYGYDLPSWDKIKYLVIYYFADNVFLFVAGEHIWNIDNICLIGNVIRAAYTQSTNNAHNALPSSECTIGCIRHFGCRMYTVKDSIAQTDSLDANNDSSPLAQVALYELLRHRIPRTTGTVEIPLTLDILPGQIVHIKACEQVADNGSIIGYKIDKDFRVTKIEHKFTVEGATTTLDLTDDVRNGLPINTQDPYTTILRAVNPDTQTKTYASLKASGSYYATLKVIAKNYPE